MLCERRQGAPLELENLEPEPEPEQPATVLWIRPLPTLQECQPAESCDIRTRSVLVDEGGILLAGDYMLDDVRASGEGRWIGRLSADGDTMFVTTLPALSAELAAGHYLVQWHLTRDADGSALLVFGYASDAAVESPGRVEGFTVAHSGELERAFAVDTIRSSPAAFAVLDGDVLIASQDPYGNHSEISRYSRNGELRWSQQGVAAPAISRGCASIMNEPDLVVRSLATDRRGYVWAFLQRPASNGIVQLDASGRLISDACIDAETADDNHDYPYALALLRVDGHDRPILRFRDSMLRIENATEGTAPLRASEITSWNEDYDGLSPAGFALDEEDRIYVATYEGSETTRRFVIDRNAEDLSSREQFEIPLTGIESPTIWGMWRAENGDIYMRILENGENVDRPREYLARIRLEPPAGAQRP